MEHRIKKRLYGTVAVLVVGALAIGAFWQERQSAGGWVQLDSGRQIRLGTFAQVQLRCRDRCVGEEALAGAFAAIDEVDRLLSRYRQDSELSEINRFAAKRGVQVSPLTFGMLERALVYCDMTGGAFDITVTPLLKVWKQAAGQGRRPSGDELAQARAHVGCDKVLLGGGDELTVRLSDEQVELNLDAIAKGYAVDRALDAIRQMPVVAGFVDIGGEIACFGEYLPGRVWQVGVQDPFAVDNDDPLSAQVRWKLKLADCAVATSGNYRQYVVIEGRKFSHIVDARTGEPAEKLPSVTVIAPSATDADALATAVSVMGPEEGMRLIESIAETEALLVAGSQDRMEVYHSSGLDRYLVTGKAPGPIR